MDYTSTSTVSGHGSDYYHKQSSGVAKAGLTLGIIGTSLAGLLATGALNGNGTGLFGTWGGNGTSRAEMEQSKIAQLESQIAELKSMRYTDGVGIDLYKNIVAYSNAADAKIAANLKDVMGYIVELDKNVALNKQATDYQFVILNNKIDCCCEKQRMQAEFDRCYNQLADSSIISYINSTFIPGQLSQNGIV